MVVLSEQQKLQASYHLVLGVWIFHKCEFAAVVLIQPLSFVSIPKVNIRFLLNPSLWKTVE